MQKARPYYLNLREIRLPLGGWVSILHRISGVGLVLLVPALLYLFMLSLRSEADFAAATGFLTGGIGLLLLVGVLWAILHHLFAGLRHLALDMGKGEEKSCAQRSARGVLVAAVGLTVVLTLGVLL